MYIIKGTRMYVPISISPFTAPPSLPLFRAKRLADVPLPQLIKRVKESNFGWVNTNIINNLYIRMT